MAFGQNKPFQNQNLNPRQSLPPQRSSPTRRFVVPPPKPAGTPGIFGDKPRIAWRDLGVALKKDSGVIPGWTERNSRKYSKQERAEFIKYFKGDRYFAKRVDTEKMIKNLEKERWKANPNERYKIDQRMNYFKRLVKDQ